MSIMAWLWGLVYRRAREQEGGVVIFYGQNHGGSGQITPSGKTSEHSLGDVVRGVLADGAAKEGWGFVHVRGETAAQAREIRRQVAGLPPGRRWLSLQVHMNAGVPNGTDLFFRRDDSFSLQLCGILLENMKRAGVPMPTRRITGLPRLGHIVWDPDGLPRDADYPNLTFVVKGAMPVVLIEAGVAADAEFANWIDVRENQEILANVIFRSIRSWLQASDGVGWDAMKLEAAGKTPGEPLNKEV